MVWWYLGGQLDPAGGSDAGFYWLAIVVRVLAELYLVGIVARDVLQPVARPGRPRGRAATAYACGGVSRGNCVAGTRTRD